MGSPADEAWLGKPFEAVVIGCGRLLRIGSDDFQIVLFAEGEQSVARSASGMDTAERCAHAGVFFDEADAAIEIAAAKQNVVE